jgi:hypothetical protein
LISLGGTCNTEIMTDESETDEERDERLDETATQAVAGLDYDTLANGILSPRHRRLAQLAASGSSNSAIAKELDYSDSRISILLRNPFIVREIRRLQDRLFEETIQQRLKNLVDPALSNIEEILKDRTNRVKVSEKFEASRWVVEKLDGKAVQKTDIGENLLGVLLDRLDAKGSRSVSAPRDIETEVKALPEAQPEALSDELADWIADFRTESK